MQFQYNELNDARLVEGEQEELEQKSETMTHIEDIKSALYEVDHALSADGTGVVGSLRSAFNALKSIGHVFPTAAELVERMETSYIELKDVAQDVSNSLADIDFDPAELDAINQRLDLLYNLEKKYHSEDVAKLIALRDNLEQKLSAIENSDDAVGELESKCKLLREKCQKYADELTKLRKKGAQEIEKEMLQRLVPLGMPNVRFCVVIEPTALSRSGQDKVSFLFSANTSTPLQPIAQVASGGEIARVMLALKVMISGAVKLPTIIFDEIDTGVSGRVAEQMAHMMHEMGQSGRQVISITHLPQIAALGINHYKVAKSETANGTSSTMIELTQQERIAEIAQMLSGSDVTAAAFEHAKELLKI